jgi:hypothetical protein
MDFQNRIGSHAVVSLYNVICVHYPRENTDASGTGAAIPRVAVTHSVRDIRQTGEIEMK